MKASVWAGSALSRPRPPKPSSTLVATRSFSFVDKFGRRQVVVAGQTYVSPETEDARRFPDAFAPVADRQSPVAERIASQSAPERSRQLAVELSAPTEVRITWKLQRALKGEIATVGRSLETAGFLRGRIEPDAFNTGTRVHITSFSNVGRTSAMRTESSLEFSESDLRDALSDPTLVGDWHVHVRPGSVNAPSPADMQFWRGNANEVSWRNGRAPGYIGIVIGAGKDKAWNVYGLEVRAWFMPPTRWDVPESDRQPRQIPIVEADF